MDTDSIVQTLGSLLMGSEEEQIQGKNQSLYAEPLDKVFNPYRKEWMRNHIAEYAAKHQSGDAGRYETYVKYLKDAQTLMGLIFVVNEENEEHINANMYMIEHRVEPLPTTGYRQWEPEVHLDVKKRKDGEAGITLFFENESFNLVLSPKEFKGLIKKLCSLPLDCEKRILQSHYREFLPEDLRDKYKLVTITEGMGNSSHGDGGYFYGHEVELKMQTHHKFLYAFRAEFLWNPGSYETIHNTVRRAYSEMEKLSKLLPGLAIVSDEGDDCGTNISCTLPSKKDYFMDRITAWSKRTTLKTVKEVMEYRGFDINKFSPERVLEQYRREKKAINRKLDEVNAVLEPEKNGWYIESKWKEIRIYISGKRGFVREEYIAIPYDCPKEVYSKILDAKAELAEFCSLMSNSHYYDYFTSVGMFPKSSGF